MKKLVTLLLTGMVLFPTSSAFADRYGGGGERGDCNREGNCNDQRRCQGDGCRGSFSPGPFDRSPVDAFNNNCLPGATCYYGDPKKDGKSDNGK